MILINYFRYSIWFYCEQSAHLAAGQEAIFLFGAAKKDCFVVLLLAMTCP
jgi:hypothetical protein